ncbi:MAG TPA: SpoIVB peptidase S55 domain-containing protein [Thermoanaerobaculia bacterium]|nr:SpoIVB peptidase S55 domain-containing protein [Thermoanaerobaculia bacterium]
MKKLKSSIAGLALAFGAVTMAAAAPGARATQPAGTPALAAVPPAADAPAEIPALQIDAIQRGDRGYGLSVFAGTDPVRFDVEILGVVRNLHPDTSFILARLSGQGLEDSGVVAGMSGSPVFVDDRLAGAVAFSWSFASDAVAGITPIGAMRDLTRLPAVPPARLVASTGAELPTIEQLLHGVFPEDLLDQRLQALAPRVVTGAASGLQWTAAGFGDATLGRLERALGQVTPSGSSPDLDLDLRAGSAVAGVLVGGDLQLTLTGTVTERRNDDILAFGHSYLGLGPIDLPMAPAEVITVVSSRATSFKLANVGPVVGAFSEDRLAGMLGKVGRRARTIPVEIRVATTPASGADAASEAERRFELEVAEIPLQTPTLAAVGVLEAMGVARHQSGNQDLAVEARLQLKGLEPLHLERHFAGSSAAINAALYVLSVMSFVMHNESEHVEIERLEVDLRQSADPRTVSLLAAHPSERRVRPGADVDLRLALRRYRGETFHRTVSVKLPADLPTGPYFLFVGDGPSIDAARLQMEPSQPDSFRESLELLRSFHRPSDLVVLGVLPSPGLVVDGKTLPRLPGSVRSIWSASGPLSAKPIGLAIRAQHAEALDFPLTGGVRVDLQVLPPRS